jgi:hypothetical protein
MIGEAQSRRAPSEQWVEKFAAVYTPIVMALVVVVLMTPLLFFGGAWQESLYRSLETAVAHPAFAVDAGDHSPEHRLFALNEGIIRRADVRGFCVALGRHRGGYGGFTRRDLQRAETH